MLLQGLYKAKLCWPSAVPTLLILCPAKASPVCFLCFSPELPAIAGAAPELVLTGFSTNLCCSTSTWPSLVFNNSFNHHLLTHRRIQHGRFSSGLSSGLSISFLANDTICYLSETTEALIFFISSRLHSFPEFLSLSEEERISCLAPDLCLFPFTSFLPHSWGLSGFLEHHCILISKSSPPSRTTQAQFCSFSPPAASFHRRNVQ